VAGRIPVRWTRLIDRAQSRTDDPHRNLMVAVLRAAIEDACDGRAAAPAMAYVTSTDRLWPFSFENLCDALDLDAGSLRRRLGTAMADAAHQRLMARCYAMTANGAVAADSS
jgi:hypothetical protein